MTRDSSDTQIYGLIGYPVAHSLSAIMHNAAFKHLNIDAEYRLFEVNPEGLEDFLLKKIFSENIAGLNITIPHKVKAREILEKKFPFDNSKEQILEDEYYVKLSGAVNTVKRDGNKLEYWNTDADGFLKSLMEEFKPYGKNVLLIGCGGAGRAVIAALGWKDYEVKKIYINDINNEAIDSARKHFSQFPQFRTFLDYKLEFVSAEDIPKTIQECQLLINASPVGMNPKDGSVIDKKLLHENLYIYDVVYNRKTQLIKDAESLRRPAKNGLGMLLYQGVDAFELWTGEPAPVAIMRQALQEELKRC